MKEIESEEIIDNNFLWYIFRKSMGQVDQKGIAPVRNEQGKLISDTEGILNECMLYNEKLLNIPENAEEYSEFYEYIDSTVKEIHGNWVKDSNVQHMLVTESEICSGYNGIDTGYNSGYNGIDTEHIKFGGSMMVTVITKIVNRAITTAIFPEVF